MKNYGALARKLQTALCLRGEHITLEEKCFYSVRYKRMLTKYIVRRQTPGRPRETLIESYRLADVVKGLGELYGEGGGRDGPE